MTSTERSRRRRALLAARSAALPEPASAGLKLGYADPPYIGCAELYAEHHDYGGEVDHALLIAQLQDEYAGWTLHAAATPKSFAVLAPKATSGVAHEARATIGSSTAT
jgi:hypothetical protein